MATRPGERPLAFCSIVQEIKMDPSYWYYLNAPAPVPPSSPRDSGYDSDQVDWARYDREKAVNDGIRPALQAADNGNIEPLLKWIALCLWDFSWSEIRGIIHDEPQKEKHVHVFIKFTKSATGMTTPSTLKRIAGAVGIAPQYIEKPEKGRYAEDNKLAYLVHIKYPNKHQYNPEQVVSIFPSGQEGKSYLEIYEERHNDWLKGRAAVAKKQAKVDIDQIIYDIVEGRLTEEQIFTDPLMGLAYAYYRRQIDDAFIARAKIKVAKMKKELKDKKRKRVTIYIEGLSGSGKSVFATDFTDGLKKLSPAEEWECLTVPAKNPFDKYTAQEIVYADDVEPDTMSISDWRHALDPTRGEDMTARYHNHDMPSYFLIMSTTLQADVFFCHPVFLSESIDQYLRRIAFIIKIVKPDFINPANSLYSIGECVRVPTRELAFGALANYDFDFNCGLLTRDEALAKALELATKWSAPDALPAHKDAASPAPTLEDAPDEVEDVPIGLFDD